MSYLAWSYKDAGKLDLALPLFEETFKLRNAKLGPDHPDTPDSMSKLSDALCETEQIQQSVLTAKDYLKRPTTVR